MATTPLATLPLKDAEATADLARRLCAILRPGDAILLDGPLGAGKSHFARAAIQDRMRRAGTMEEVPSPTYTLVQTYSLPGAEFVHADLYRLADPGELAELGFPDLFEAAICLVEWPDRLGDLAPPGALHLALALDGEGRIATLSSADPSWRARLDAAEVAACDAAS